MNWLGFKTLYFKEVRRFLNVYNQTIIAPLINALLLLAIFSLVLGERNPNIENIPVLNLIIPGLIMMTVIQNAFANTSSTMIFGKVLGVIIDLLIPPLSPRDITLALMLGGITRGICSGLAVGGVVYILGHIFIPELKFEITNFGLAIFYLFFSSMMLALLGMIAGILSDTFDQMAAYSSFIITPLSFLSGTFYSIKSLPDFWYKVSHFNPFFYMMDGFRYALTGHNDSPIIYGVCGLLIANLILFLATYKMLKSGYRLKS